MVDLLGEITVQVLLQPYVGSYQDKTGAGSVELHESLTEYLGGLITELCLPFLLTLAVEVASEPTPKNGIPLPPFDLKINGQLCHFPRQRSFGLEISPLELAIAISRVAYHNRDLLITSTLSQAILENWKSKYPPQALPPWSQTDFLWLIREVIHNGLSLLWIEGAISSGSLDENELEVEAGMEGSPTVASIFDEIIFTADSTSIVVLLPDTEYQQVSTSNFADITKILYNIQQVIFNEYGVVLPTIQVSSNPYLEAGWFRVQVNNLRFPPMRGLSPDQLLINQPPERIKLMRLDAIPAEHPSMIAEFSIVPKASITQYVCNELDATTWGSMEYIALAVQAIVHQNLSHFLTQELVEFKLWQLNKQTPRLIDLFLEAFSIRQLSAILRELVEDRVSIRNLRGILEALLEARQLQSGKTSVVSTEEWCQLVRIALRRQITVHFSRDCKKLAILILDPFWEGFFSSSDPLPEDILKSLIDSINFQLGPHPTEPLPAVVVTSKMRRKVSRALQLDFPFLQIMSYDEIWEEYDVFPIGRIAPLGN